MNKALARVCGFPLALLYVAVVVLDRSPAARRSAATAVMALVCIAGVVACR